MEAETRAVSADHGKLTPLVVLVPSVATLILTALALSLFKPLTLSRPFAPLVLIGGAAASIGVGCRFYGKRLVVCTVLLTILAGVLGLAFLVLWGVGEALGCVESPSGWWFVGAIGGPALVYFVLGTAAFRTRHPLLAVSAAVLLAWSR